MRFEQDDVVQVLSEHFGQLPYPTVVNQLRQQNVNRSFAVVTLWQAYPHHRKDVIVTAVDALMSLQSDADPALS